METKRLYVGNLPYSLSEDDVMSAFAAYGATSVSLPVAPDGRKKGFGFVDVAADKLEDAINDMNGKDFGGRNLTVNEARPREDRGPRN